MEICCLGDEDTVRGFRLAGVVGLVVDDPVLAMDVLRSVVTNTDVALVLVTGQVAAWVGEADRGVLGGERPLVWVIRGMSEGVGETGDLSRLVEGAIGVRLEKGV